MSDLDAHSELLRKQREIISKKELKPFTKRSDVPGLIYFFGLLAVIAAPAT